MVGLVGLEPTGNIRRESDNTAKEPQQSEDGASLQVIENLLTSSNNRVAWAPVDTDSLETPSSVRCYPGGALAPPTVGLCTTSRRDLPTSPEHACKGGP